MTTPIWHIRRALPSDLPAILAVEQACPEAPHWSHASWLDALAQDQGEQQPRASFIANDPTGILGFAVATCAGELAELETIAVSPTARRQGIGKALLQATMEWSQARGAQTMELEVRASSVGVQALYQRSGFVEQGKRRSYYRNPDEDAILMTAVLQDEAPLDVPGDAARRIDPDAKV